MDRQLNSGQTPGPGTKLGPDTRTVVVSYSLTGNNEALARSLAAALQGQHLRVLEARPRTVGKILLDLLLNRTPPVRWAPERVQPRDQVVFVAPVWMGKVASPLRACFRQLRSRIGPYAFVSISGGADGPNPRLAGELKERLEREPECVIDLHVAALLPPEPRPQRKDTSAYRISEADTRELTEKALSALRGRLEGGM